MANAYFYSNVAVPATLSGSINNAVTSATVSTTVGWPTSFPFIIALDFGAANEELVQVTANAANTLTIARAFGGTSAVSHSIGAVVRHVFNAQDATDFRTHEAASTNVHGLTGGSAVVGTTTSQTLTNKTLTSPTITGPTVTGGGSLAGTFTGTPTFSGAVVLSGTPSISAGAALAGTFTGTPTFSGNVVFSGNPSFTATPTLSGASALLQGSKTSAAQVLIASILSTGDTFDRWRAYVDGLQEWGPGTGARDTNLYRSAADTLKTDDSFVVGSALSVTGNSTLTGNLSVGGIGQVLFARKTSGTTRNNTGTNASDPDLTVTVATNSVYVVECCLFVSGGSAADFQAAWSGPAGIGGSWSLYGPSLSVTTSGTTGEVRYNSGTITGTRVAGTSDTATPLAMPGIGLLTTAGTGGTFVLQWAQNVATAVNTTLEADSWIRLTRVI